MQLDLEVVLWNGIEITLDDAAMHHEITYTDAKHLDDDVSELVVSKYDLTKLLLRQDHCYKGMSTRIRREEKLMRMYITSGREDTLVNQLPAGLAKGT